MTLLDGAVPPAIVLAAGALLAAARARRGGRSAAADAVRVAALLALVAALEIAMGRSVLYRHGPVRLWSGEVRSDQNSQQVADPYTATHVIHGFLLYPATRAVLGGRDLGLLAVAAAAVEGAWEAVENTDAVIERYRAETISLDYYGDSVLNSVGDVAAALGGFFLAARAPAVVTVVAGLAIEGVLAATIRDNLTLNVLMLLRPVEAVRAWQAGG